MNMYVVRRVQWAPVLVEGDVNAYVGKRVQLGCHTHGDTPDRMEYAPLETMFPPLESSK